MLWLISVESIHGRWADHFIIAASTKENAIAPFDKSDDQRVTAKELPLEKLERIPFYLGESGEYKEWHLKWANE